MNTYEAMFVFDPSFATDFQNVEREVGRLMERAGAEVIMSRKWDERKLAYEISGRKRGCYVLTFFKSDTGKVAGIERDAQLSESVLRLLIMRADHMTEADMETAYRAKGESISATKREFESREKEESEERKDPGPEAAPQVPPPAEGSEAQVEEPVAAAKPTEPPAEPATPSEPAAAPPEPE